MLIISLKHGDDVNRIMDDKAMWLRVNISNNQGTYTGWIFGAWLK